MMFLLRAMLVAALIAGCGKVAMASPPAAPLAAEPPAGPGFDPAEFDDSVRPQDDFWAYANGKWLAGTEIPPEWSGYGNLQIVAEHTEQQLHALIEAAAGSQAAASQDAQKIGGLYRSFMDEARVEQLGLAPLAGELAGIDALRTPEDVIAWFGQALTTGIQGPITVYVDADATDPSRALAYFWQDGLGLPDRDYYLDDRAELGSARAAYEAHITRMFQLAGWPGGDAAARTVMGIERRLAEKQWSAVQNRDDEKIYRNQVDLPSAVARSPGFDWPRFLSAAGLHPPGRFVLAQDDYFAALGTLVRSVPVTDWKTYLRFKLLKSYAPYLTAPIVAEDFAFEGGVLQGTTENKARWKRGVKLVSTELGELLGKMYVAQYFPASSRQRIDDMIGNLREAFRQSIDTLSWMTPATKQAALQKLAKFGSKVGYPAKWRDYSTVRIAPDDLVGNLRRTRAFAFEHEAEKLTKPVDRDEWLMTPQTINAYYLPSGNEIVFPAAILQPPFFIPTADDAFNYGSIGATIGHEFSHGFDDQGRKFDGDGRLRDWWTPADTAQYAARTKALVEQYDLYRPLRNFSINGQLTLGENIADLAGLVVAHRAWIDSLQGREAPVIDGFSGEQRFFLGYATSFRGKQRPEALRSQLLSDPHSPDEFRVTGVVRNVPAFYSAFGVKEGDRMYLAPEQRVQIW